jgi:hypothetical protein
MPRFMRPIRLGAPWALPGVELVAVEQLQVLVQPASTPPLPAEAPPIPGSARGAGSSSLPSL